MLFLSGRRAEHLGGGAKLRLRHLPVGFRHFGGQTDHRGGKADVIWARRAFFVEFRRLGLGVEGARGHFNNARPDRHERIIARGALSRHPDAMGMKPQASERVHSS
jgi:hypothetical protein